MSLRNFEDDEVPGAVPPPVQAVPDPQPESGRTLAEARQWVMDNLDPGVDCPCCDQLAKQYDRKFIASLAVCMAILLRLERQVEAGAHLPEEMHRGGGWFHIPKVVQAHNPSKANQGGYAGSVAQYWGLIQGDGDVREDGSSRTGWYRLTDLGRRFAEGRATIPTYATTYNAEVLRLHGDRITIQQALGNRFNYEELMAGE